MNDQVNFRFLRMGVMNITPNSFSDGGELSSIDSLLNRLEYLNQFEAIDIGAESTAPMNVSISWTQEWERLERLLPCLSRIKTSLSLDTYHPETIFKFLEFWKGPLIWNDISGKFDEDVKKFLNLKPEHRYVYCHNLSPTRELCVSHMDYLSKASGIEFLNELSDYFNKVDHAQVIFDPCLGFSKSYDQNWFILDNFEKLIEKCLSSYWLIGFSRKSFLRKKYNLTLNDRDDLDQVHVDECLKLKNRCHGHGNIWIRTHRPELISEVFFQNR